MKRSRQTGSFRTISRGTALRLGSLLLAVALIVLLVPVVAQADPIADAQAIFQKASAERDRQGAIDARIGKTLNRALASKSNAKALSLLAAVDADLARITGTSESQAALMEQLAALDVSQELKTFAGQQQAIEEQYQQVYRVLGELVAKYKLVARRWGDLDNADRKQLRQDIAGLQTQLQTQWTQVKADAESSAQYYDTNQLDSELTNAQQPATSPDVAVASLTSGAIVGIVVGGLLASTLFALVCGLLARRKKRSVAGWAVLGFFFGLIPLVVVAVLSEKKPAPPEDISSPSPPAPSPPAASPPPPPVATA
jgi:hypothetical protein